MKTKSNVILGATGSVGRDLAQRLLQKGERVIAAVRNPSKADALPELSGASIRIMDSESWDSIHDLFQDLAKQGETIDGVAVCVGSILLKPAHLTSEEEYRSVLRENLLPCFATLSACVRPMMKTGGSIVFVSSAAARHGLPNHEAIAAAKAGVIGLMQSAAASYANFGIRVNCIAPGLVDSAMATAVTQNDASLKASKAMHALGRIGEPHQVASAIEWLLAEEQSWITGQTIGVDGGLSTVFSKRSLTASR